MLLRARVRYYDFVDAHVAHLLIFASLRSPCCYAFVTVPTRSLIAAYTLLLPSTHYRRYASVDIVRMHRRCTGPNQLHVLSWMLNL